MHIRLMIVTLLVLTFSIISIGCSEKKSIEPDNDLMIVSNFTQEFIAPIGGPSPNQFKFTITNSSRKILNYTISKNSSWIKIINSRRSLNGFTNDTIIVEFQVSIPQILPQGTYYDTILITTDSTLQDPIEREMILHIGSEIATFPKSFTVVVNTNGPNPDTLELDINSTSLVNFDVGLSNSSSWLTLQQSNYNTADPNNVKLSINLTGLTTGDYIDTIWFVSDTALNSPHSVLVTLQVKSWLSQESPKFPNFNNLNDVFFADSQNGWVVGGIVDDLTRSGFMTRTTNGGKNWEKVFLLSTTNSSDSTLGGVTFIDNEGWIIGANGIIMHSNNFGENWSFQTPPNNMTFDFKDLFFVNADSGWVVGDSGVILFTADGGLNWSQQNSHVSIGLTGISFIDNLHGWIAGLTDIILVTADGGNNWTRQSVPFQPLPGVGDKFDFKEIMFVDNLHGWAVGKLGTVVSTVDGGSTWNFQEIPQQPGLLGLFFIDELNGWVSGKNGEILQTTDGGTSWTNQFIGSTNSLQSIFFINQNVGWAVGSDGKIIFTSSGGN